MYALRHRTLFIFRTTAHDGVSTWLAAAFCALVLAFACPDLCAQDAAQPAATQPQPAQPGSAVQAKDRPATVAPAQAPGASELAGEGKLRFAFDGAPWREVIKWLADEAGLALHLQDVPQGSFSYSDPGVFTLDAAIDRVNLFLLAQGYTLVRSGKLLTVINLEDPRSRQQLDALAKLVSVEQLATLNPHDVVKCIFPLGELKAEDAVDELGALKLMTAPAVFTRTNRLMVTDTVARLRGVKSILDAFQPRGLDNGTVMKNFPLKHASAEDILVVARPHLGLATGEMIGIDVSISADLDGKNIFVTGVEDKVKLIEGLITSLDRPAEAAGPVAGKAELKSYAVPGGNVETVYNVLQTLLAGRSIRLSMDEKAQSIVALAAPEVHREIAATVKQLEAQGAEFEVIPLKSVDPYFAISLLEEMLDLNAALLEDKDRRDEDPLPALKIDADPSRMQLYVRGTRSQIDQVKKIVAGLDAGEAVPSDPQGVRVFPLHGREALQALETAARFWRRPNLIALFPSTVSADWDRAERVVAESATASLPPQQAASGSGTSPRILAGSLSEDAAMIRCQLSPRGLLVQSEDTAAVDRLWDDLRTIVGSPEGRPARPVVFYLKYAKPEHALRMLSEMLDGGFAAQASEIGTLVNGYVAGGPAAFAGSFVSSRNGTTTLTAGTLTIVADARLNRLIAQGTQRDIELIESYLRVIDKDNSITEIKTYGTSHVIELTYTRASEVAETLREAYAGRIVRPAGSAGTGGDPGQRRGAPSGDSNRPPAPQPAPQPPAPSVAGGGAEPPQAGPAASDRRAPRGQPAPPDLEPKLTIAVHEPSNSLIVTAPDLLFAEVEQLVKTIDQRNQRVVEIVRTPADSVQALSDVLETEVDRRRRSPAGFNGTSRSGAGRSAAGNSVLGRSGSATTRARSDR